MEQIFQIYIIGYIFTWILLYWLIRQDDGSDVVWVYIPFITLISFSSWIFVVSLIVDFFIDDGQ